MTRAAVWLVVAFTLSAAEATEIGSFVLVVDSENEGMLFSPEDHSPTFNLRVFGVPLRFPTTYLHAFGTVDEIALNEPIVIDDSTAADLGVDWLYISSLFDFDKGMTDFSTSVHVDGSVIAESGGSCCGPVGWRQLNRIEATLVSYSKTPLQNGLYEYRARTHTRVWATPTTPEPSAIEITMIGLLAVVTHRKIIPRGKGVTKRVTKWPFIPKVAAIK